jgi:hypothetical protein
MSDKNKVNQNILKSEAASNPLTKKTGKKLTVKKPQVKYVKTKVIERGKVKSREPGIISLQHRVKNLEKQLLSMTNAFNSLLEKFDIKPDNFKVIKEVKPVSKDPLDILDELTGSIEGPLNSSTSYKKMTI